MKGIKGVSTPPPCNLHGDAIVKILDMLLDLEKRVAESEKRITANRTLCVHSNCREEPL